ncbi:MAG: PmoA family protein [Vicinamibacterales bacterium]|nr:PmoA family protein [Vicinamibacterales bacterium]
MSAPLTVLFVLASAALAHPCTAQEGGGFTVDQDDRTGAIKVRRAGSGQPVLTHEAQASFRPFLHPITAPDGHGVLTEFSPDHHKHQTGIYWGFTRLNGRDYFHHPGGDHWRRKSATVLEPLGPEVAWQLEYDLLGENGQPLLTETQRWSLTEADGSYMLDLIWSGQAHVDVTIGKYDYGGLFMRMPWRQGIPGAATSSQHKVGEAAEGQRATWVDVGMQIEGRPDHGHIAILDHSMNHGFPQHWRVDGALGVGPVRARRGDWHIKRGETEIIRHRLVVYTGELDSAMLADQWSAYTGSTHSTNLWQLAGSAGREAEWLTPQAAVEAMTLKPGFEVNVWASEPMMTQPMAFCWDDRGRLWVAENRDYESRGHGFSKFGDSRILILEDTDRDGVADKREVFLEGIPFPAAIAVGMGGLWLGAPPNLLFIPDRDGDDRADLDDIEVRLTGWGISDRHETLNSFHWGPDGWLYGCQGFATGSLVGKPEGGTSLLEPGDPFRRDFPLQGAGTQINGGVWRYHPTKQRFEVVAHGFSNPWGIDHDAQGQLFITACVIPHLWHIVPGGIYHRQGGKHFNPYVYDDIKTIVDHKHRSAHGGASIYLSDAFPPEYQGQLFMANIHEHAVLTDVLEPVGSGFVARHGSDLLLANNAQWIGFSTEIGPGGDVFVLDWHDGDICGRQVLNKDSGRIFRITPTESRAIDWPGRYDNLADLDDEGLVSLQGSPSEWHARRARLILQGRAASGALGSETHARLRELFSGGASIDLRLRGMWGLHVTGGLDEATLVAGLNDSDPYVRAWSIQLLCEDSAPGVEVLGTFAELAVSDPSPVVRLYLAAAMQRLEPAARWPIATGLVSHAEDATDHNIPKMVWFGIEPAVAQDPQRALQIAGLSKLPQLAHKIARRLTAAGELDALVACIGESSTPRAALLAGLRDGLRGRKEPKAPANWDAVYPSLLADPASARLATELAQGFGDRSAARTLLETLDDRGAPAQDRLQALRALASAQDGGLRDRLEALMDDADLRLGAIRAVAAYEVPALADAMMARYPSFSVEERLAVVQTLASRSRYGHRLTRAIREGKVARRDVPAYVARQLRNVVGAGFVEVWGSVESLSADTQAALEKYRALLTNRTVAAADPSRGRAVFERTCAECHTMYGVGRVLGPDITGSNRADLDYILSNILNPSEEIGEAYQSELVLTDDGRLYTGLVISEDDNQVTLRVTGEEQDVVIAKAQIESRRTDDLSIMPAGLLDTLADQEVAELIAYLRTSIQVELPAGHEGRK